jgi:vitamin B12 transporter
MLLLFISAGRISAQEDSIRSFQLSEYVHVTDKIKFIFPNHFDQKLNYDSLFLNQSSLSELLQFQSTAYIKTYGPSGLSTSSIRGGSASHTIVVWNGFNITNPSTGQNDFNLIPGGIQDWKFYPGGSSSMWGSGAIAGSFILNTIPSQKNALILASEYISTNDLRNSLTYHCARTNFSSSTRIWYNTAENNFFFTNYAKPSLPKEQMTNAKAISAGAMQDLHFHFNSNNSLNIHLWYNQSERQIPPTLLQEKNEAIQSDLFLRVAADYYHKFKKNYLILRSGVFEDLLHYSDSISSLSSKSKTRKIINEAGLHIASKERFEFITGIQYQNTIAENSGYETLHKQDLYAAFASGKFTGKKMETSVSVRKEYVKEIRDIPIVPSWVMNYRINEKLILSTVVSRNFRLPTFNDLFWTPGGNPDLKPESGWSEELKIDFTPFKKKEFFRYSLNIFNRNISNWIIWLPGDNFWSPANVMEVWSRGFENRLQLSHKINDILFLLVLKYDYIRSTNEETESEDDPSLGKQLIYSPQDAANGTLSIAYKKAWIGFHYHYTGYRFISSDHTQWLDPYDVVNIYAGYSFRMKNHHAELYGRINNLFNEYIEAIPWQASPGTHFTVGFKINFQLKNSSNKNEYEKQLP